MFLIQERGVGQHELYIARRIERSRERVQRARVGICKVVRRIPVQIDHCPERSLRHCAVGRKSTYAIVKNTIAAADTGLAVAENIIGESGASAEIFPRRVETTIGKTGVAWIKNAGRSIRIPRRPPAWTPRRQFSEFIGVRKERI